jgi:dynamin 1-like protein
MDEFPEHEKLEEEVVDFKHNDVMQKYSSKHYNYFPRYPLPPVPDRITMNSKPKAREEAETELIKKLIISYFNVVKKNINDLVPKSIVTFLIN